MARHVGLTGLSLALCCILTGPAASPAVAFSLPPAVPSGYALNWSDEFNGADLDLSKWQVQGGGDSYSVGDGTLKLTVWTDSGGVDHIGYINNYRHDSQQTYGYFVANVKFNKTQIGSSSAFFTYSTDMGATGNPVLDGSEVDIFEHYPQYTGQTNVRNKAMISEWWRQPSDPTQGSSLWTPSIGLNDGNFHLFALLWTPTAYQVFIDNTLYRTMTDAVSQHSEYVLLDCDREGSPGPFGYNAGGYGPLGSAQNAEMTVDYVRIYTPHPGDANLDGKVDVSDLAILAANYRKHVTGGWAQADFNNDGMVDVQDLAVLAANYRYGVASDVVPGYDGLDAAAIEFLSLAGVTMAPEPGTLIMLAVALIGTSAYTCRRRK